MGGVVGTVKYAQYKIKSWMEEEEKRYLEELKKQQHFEKTQDHCHNIVKAVVNSLMESVLAALNTGDITDRLKKEKSSEEKLALWKELKVLVFAQIATSVYVITLTSVIIRIQLNQLAAKVYTNTSRNQTHDIGEETQRWFLSLSHEYVKKSGLKTIIGEMKRIFHDLTDSLPLESPFGSKDLESLCKSFHDKLETSSHLSSCMSDDGFSIQPNILSVLLPDPSSIESEDSSSTKTLLVNELWDILDSQDCRNIFENSITKSFKDLCMILHDNLSGRNMAAINPRNPSLTQFKSSTPLPLAKVLPILNSQVHLISSDTFIHKILGNPMLSNFSANIYESFTEKEVSS